MSSHSKSGVLHLPTRRSEPVAVQQQPADVPPPAVRATLKAAPAIRNVYWCEFPRDMRQPLGTASSISAADRLRSQSGLSKSMPDTAASLRCRRFGWPGAGQAQPQPLERQVDRRGRV